MLISRFEEQQRDLCDLEWSERKSIRRQGQRGGRELDQIGSYKPPSEFWIFPWMRWEGNRGFWAEEGHDLIYFLANHCGCCVETRVWRKKGRKSESSL